MGPSSSCHAVESLEGRLCLHSSVSADNFGVNAGGPTYTDSTGLEWEADHGFTSSKDAQKLTTTAAIANTSLDTLFHTTRYDFNMKFADSVPNGTYSVSLYFAEQRYSSAGQRLFSVNMEGGRVLSNFDIYRAAGGKNTAVIKTFNVKVSDGTLNVDFITGATKASINAIRVQPASTSGTGTGSTGTFHPGTIHWSSKASAPVKREEGVSFVSSGKLYVVGGYVNGAFQATTRVDVYNPATNTWSRKKDAPSKITHTGLAVDGKTGFVWMCGGFIGDFPEPPGTATVRVYHPSSDTWTTGPSLPVARGGGGAAIINNKLYYFSGASSDRASDSANCYVLDLANTSAGWKNIASIPHKRNHFGSAVVNGKYYAIGGQTGLEGKSVAMASVDVYDPVTNTWSSTTPMPKGYSHFTSTLSVYKGRYILIAGGENPHNTALSYVYAFDTVTKKWAQLTSLPAARRAMAGGIIGDKYIVTGGYKYGQNQLADTWVADLDDLNL